MKDHIICPVLLLLFWQKYFHSFLPLSFYTFLLFSHFFLSLLISSIFIFLLFYSFPSLLSFFLLFLPSFYFFLPLSCNFFFYFFPSLFFTSFLSSTLPSSHLHFLHLIFTAFLSYTEMQVFPFSRLSRFSSYVRCTDKIISVITLTGSDALHEINYIIFFEDFFVWRLSSSWY